MAETRFKFSGLRHLLSELGFREVSIRKPYVGFQHEESDALIVLPPYRNNAFVAPHHLVQVRVTLDAKGLMEAEEFDRLVGHAPAKHSASS